MNYLFKLFLLIFRGNKQAKEHSINLPLATYSPWQKDSSFQTIYNQVSKNTLVDKYRLYDLWKTCSQISTLPGICLEIGSWRGGSAAIIAQALKDNQDTSKLFIWDTFEGVVKTSNRDLHYNDGAHSNTSSDIVESLFKKLNLNNIIVNKGIFPDALENDQDYTRIKFCHIDVDVYKSAEEIFKWLEPRLVNGAIIIFDDYGFYGCNGITDFVNSISSNQRYFFIHNLNGHATFLKR